MTDRLMIQFARGFSADDQMDDLRGQHPQAKRMFLNFPSSMYEDLFDF